MERAAIRSLGSHRSSALEAAQGALRALRMMPSEVDLSIGTSVHGRDLASALGIRAPAWLVDSRSTSALSALQIAQGLLSAGSYRNILVVASSPDECGAAAAVIAPAKARAEGIGSGYFLDAAEAREKALRELAERCIRGALARQGLALSEIRHFSLATPWAAAARLVGEALDIDPDRISDSAPGPSASLLGLHRALAEGRIEPGERALLFAADEDLSAGALVVGLGDVAATNSPRNEPAP